MQTVNASPSPAMLAYASPATTGSRHQSMRLPRQSPWGELASLLVALTLIFCAWCCVGMYLAAGGGLWVLYGLVGSWIGGGFGVLFALIGCCQRTHRRSLSAHALWWNALVVALPTTAVAFLVLSNLPRC